MANSFYDPNHEDTESYKKMVVLCVAAASVVMLLFLVVLYVNGNGKKAAEEKEADAPVVEEELQEDMEIGKSNLVSSDLDFWDLYDADKKPAPENETTNSVSANFTDKKKPTDAKNDGDEDPEEGMSAQETLDDAPSDEEMNDGKHIAIVDKEGNKIWYEILDSIPHNTYQLNQNLTKNGEQLSYSENGKNSVFGIDVSKYQGDIDWALVRESGVKFAMLRVAVRGYDSGQLLLDENFVKYAEGAYKNGIKIGAYVYSQAKNELEAIEEANFAVAATANYHITYPIGIDVEEATNETSRTSSMTAAERTKCVKAFCDTVKSYGHKPVIYANRDMLIAKLDMEILKDYDVWLSDSNGTVDANDNTGTVINSSTGSGSNSNVKVNAKSGNSTSSSSTMNNQQEGSSNSSSSSTGNSNAGISTDYPYRFTMWQYSKSGTIKGINGSTDLNISFVDYEEK